MTRSVVFALDDHFVVVFVVAVDEEGEELRRGMLVKHSVRVVRSFLDIKTYESDEESERRNNRQRPTSLQHRARLVDVDGPRTVALAAVVPERSEIEV